MDSYIRRLGLGAPKKKFSGEFWGPERVEGTRMVFLKPHTFMNLSGSSVSEAVHFYDIPCEDILIIYDDVALAFGRLRMRENGSAGGQKGMHSIIQSLKTQKIPRLRVGVGSPIVKEAQLSNWVLGQFNAEERKQWGEIEDAAWKALSLWSSSGISTAMSHVNGASS